MVAEGGSLLAVGQAFENFAHFLAPNHADIKALQHEAAPKVIREAYHVFRAKDSRQEFQNAINNVCLEPCLATTYCLRYLKQIRQNYVSESFGNLEHTGAGGMTGHIHDVVSNSRMTKWDLNTLSAYDISGWLFQRNIPVPYRKYEVEGCSDLVHQEDCVQGHFLRES